MTHPTDPHGAQESSSFGTDTDGAFIALSRHAAALEIGSLPKTAAEIRAAVETIRGALVDRFSLRAELDRERTNHRHAREECGKLHARVEGMREAGRAQIAETQSLRAEMEKTQKNWTVDYDERREAEAECGNLEAEVKSLRAELERVTKELADSRAYALNREEALDESQRRSEIVEKQRDDARAERDRAMLMLDGERALCKRAFADENEVRVALDEAGVPATEALPPGVAGCRVFSYGHRIRLLADRAREAEGERERLREELRVAHLDIEETSRVRHEKFLRSLEPTDRVLALLNEGDAIKAERDALRAAVKKAHDLIDRAMGDTDPDDPDDPLLRACQVLTAALSPAPEDGSCRCGCAPVNAQGMCATCVDLLGIAPEPGQEAAIPVDVDLFRVAVKSIKPPPADEYHAPSSRLFRLLCRPGEATTIRTAGGEIRICVKPRAGGMSTPAPEEGGEA